MFVKAGAGSLAERLGFPPDARLVIVNCDDLGSSVEANTAIYEVLRSRAAGSATLMVPCPALDDACARYDGDDVGVHLTVTSEWDTVRWGPLTPAPSLRLHDDTFPKTAREVRTTAATNDVAIECRAQIRGALDAGIDVSHLDSHMHVLMNDQRLARVLVDLAAEFDLPVRLPVRLPARRRRGLNWRRRVCEARRRAARRGVVVPDRFVDAPVGSRGRIMRALDALQPGVTEMLVHPVVDSPTLRATFPDWEERVDDYSFMVSGELGNLLDATGARLIGYRELRELQRAGS